jgi:hypothetical protein
VPGSDPGRQFTGAAADVEHPRTGHERQRADRVVDRRLSERVGERDAVMRDRGERGAVHG